MNQLSYAQEAVGTIFWNITYMLNLWFSDFQIARNREASNHWPTTSEVDRTLSFLTERIGSTTPFSRPSQRRTTLRYARSITRCQLWTQSSPAWRPRSEGSPRPWSPWRERWRSILNSTNYSREKKTFFFKSKNHIRWTWYHSFCSSVLLFCKKKKNWMSYLACISTKQKYMNHLYRGKFLR